LELGQFLDNAIRVTAAAALLAGVSYLVWYGLDEALGRSTIAQIVSLGAALLAGAAAYFAAVLALRVPEARQILRLVRHV
jgi:putative peptidoglycan lipid II flippase